MGVETPERPRAAAPDSPGTSVPRALGHLVVAILQAIARAIRRLRRWNRRGGAGGSGLAALIELHAVQGAADTFVTVALASSLFFSVRPGEARDKVALYLLITMAPFAVVAPVLGPLLDRFRHGRRIAMAVTMGARATLAIVIAHNLGGRGVTQLLALYPAALGVLVAGKAYNIVRSAAVPRLVPDGMTLVQANARLTFAIVVFPGVAGVVAIGTTKLFGHTTTLRLGAVLYAVALLLALQLPRQADGGAATRAAETPAGRGLLRLTSVHPDVRTALRSTAVLRALSGFLLLYGAFVVRQHHIGGLGESVSLAALAVGLGVGNLLGTTTGARLARRRSREIGALLLLASLATTLYTAIDYGLVSVFAVAVVSSAAAATAKLCLDATIQQRVDESVRTSTFARSETALQLAWVAGGALGIVLPTRPVVGFLVATAGLGVASAGALGVRYRRRHAPGSEQVRGEEPRSDEA